MILMWKNINILENQHARFYSFSGISFKKMHIEKEKEFKRHLKENKLRGCVVVLQEPAKMY